MEKALTAFAGGLRQTGVKVSQAELLDASEALGRVDLGERGFFKDALRTTLIKRCKDIPVFDALFDIHFCTSPWVGSAPARDETDPLHDLQALLREARPEQSADSPTVAELILSGRFGELLRMALSASESLGLQNAAAIPLRGTFFLNRLRQLMGWLCMNHYARLWQNVVI